ncbi:MAG TPA: aminotransferase class IV [Chloroflexota bacterium]
MDVLLNGRFVPYEQATVPIDDRGFQFSESLYEVIHVYAGRPFEMGRHMKRLQVGLEVLDIDLGMSTDSLAERCMELVRRNGLSDALIYIQITSGHAPRIHLRPGGLEPTVIVTTSPAKPAAESWPETGINCLTVGDDRWAGCYVKTTMLLANTLAKRRAVAEGYDDALFVKDGYAIESTASNLFAVIGGVLVTPPTSNYILGGITREVVLDLARELGVPVREGPIPVVKMYRADELFITASGIELSVIASVDGRTIGSGRPGPVVQKLRQAFRRKTLGN